MKRHRLLALAGLAAAPARAIALGPGGEVSLFPGGARTSLRLDSVVRGAPPGGAATPVAPDASGDDDVTLVLRLEITGGRPGVAGGLLVGASPFLTMAGWIPGTDEPDPLRDVQIGVASDGLVGFAFTDKIAKGERSNLFFVSLRELTTDAQLSLGLTGFGESSTLFSVRTPVELVPEPSGAALLAFGLIALRAARRQTVPDAPASCARAARGRSRRGRRRRGAA